jgi:uncharacterized membrane protein
MKLQRHDRLPFACLLCLVAPAIAEGSGLPAYVIQPLAAPAGQSMLYPHSIDASGEVVGDGWPTMYVASVDSARPIEVFDPTTSRYLNLDSAWRINDAGVIAGTAYRPTGQITFIQSATSTEIVAVTDSIYGTTVQDMNNAGTIVGDYFSTSADHLGERAYVYANHTFTLLGSLPDSVDATGQSFSIALAINDSGVIAGNSRTADSSYPAVLFHDGQVTSLGTPPGFTTAGVRAINNAGTIVGEACNVPIFSRDPSASAMFLYEGGHYTLIPSPGGRIVPLDINSSGDVVGVYYYADASHAMVPFIYHDGVLSDLAEVLDPSSGWALTGADAINDAGQILVDGSYLGQEYAAVMTPVPEPVGLCGLVAFVAAGVRRRKVAR